MRAHRNHNLLMKSSRDAASCSVVILMLEYRQVPRSFLKHVKQSGWALASFKIVLMLVIAGSGPLLDGENCFGKDDPS